MVAPFVVLPSLYGDWMKILDADIWWLGAITLSISHCYFDSFDSSLRKRQV